MRSEKLAEAYKRARDEQGIGEEEVGHLVRICQYEWLAFLSPSEPSEREKAGIKLIIRTSE